MAKSAITKAAKELRKINDSKKMARVKAAMGSQEIQAGGGAAAGIMGAALLDKKYGEGGEVAKVKSIPVNLAAGAALFGVSYAMKKMPGRALLGGVGFGAGLGGLYRLVHDNVDFDGQS